MNFLALFITLPTKASTGRMRVWRSLKALGCATLRDGVCLLPDLPEHATALQSVAAEVLASHGSAEVYRLSGCDEAQDEALRALFDRAAEFATIVHEIRTLHQELQELDSTSATRRLQVLARRCDHLARVDFFPGEAQGQAFAALNELREAVVRRFSPDEPTARDAAIPRLNLSDYRGRTWATRARPWVDRLACAWLIQRHIDPDASFVWLAHPADCRAEWLGFDFDGASFSHVGAKVTFETLLASFGLDRDPALERLGDLVHCLDVGGLPVAEGPGVEAVLAGLRASEPNDDALLARASSLFDWIMQSFKPAAA